MEAELSEFSVFDFHQILEATDNFSDENKLGEGGFGPVYKGSNKHATQMCYVIRKSNKLLPYGYQNFIIPPPETKNTIIIPGYMPSSWYICEVCIYTRLMLVTNAN